MRNMFFLRTVVVLPVLFLLAIVTGGTSFGQSSQCVIVEKHDNMVLVSCGGGGTQNIDIGGKADIYKVGDTIDLGSTSGSSTTGQGTRPSSEKSTGQRR